MRSCGRRRMISSTNPSDTLEHYFMKTNIKSASRTRTASNWGLGTAKIVVGKNSYAVTTFDGRYVFENTFNGKSYGPEATQTERITAYLSNGYAIDQASATKMFGCKNIRAAMSVIRAKVERYGNWRVIQNDEGTEYSLMAVILISPQDLL